MTDRTLRAVHDSGAQGASSGTELTIEQLAHETGMTVRNIRNHQSRGLLPPPEVRMRTGYYGPDHVARLELIKEMQADGFNLNAIKRLLTNSPGAADKLLGFKRAVSMPFESEPPELISAEELAERFGPGDPRDIAKAEKLGLIVDLGNGSYEAPSPALMRAADGVLASGVSLAAALIAIEQVKRQCEAAARAFVKLFLKEVWLPFEEAGHPTERWPEVLEAIESLRPIAAEAVLGVFALTMTREVESAFGKAVERQAKRGR